MGTFPMFMMMSKFRAVVNLNRMSLLTRTLEPKPGSQHIALAFLLRCGQLLFLARARRRSHLRSCVCRPLHRRSQRPRCDVIFVWPHRHIRTDRAGSCMRARDACGKRSNVRDRHTCDACGKLCGELSFSRDHDTADHTCANAWAGSCAPNRGAEGKEPYGHCACCRIP